MEKVDTTFQSTDETNFANVGNNTNGKIENNLSEGADETDKEPSKCNEGSDYAVTQEQVGLSDKKEVDNKAEQTDMENLNKNSLSEEATKRETESTEAKKFDENDEYGYTKTEHFTSEIFKIEIRNLPRNYGYSNWKKLFKNRIKVPGHKIQVIKNVGVVYVTFKSQEDKDLALQRVNELPLIKSCKLEAKNAKPKKDAMAKKRSRADDGDLAAKIAKIENPQESLKDSLIPWWRMNYELQLEELHQHVSQCMRDFHKFICNHKPLDKEIWHWLMEQKHHHNGLLCSVLPVLPSPEIDQYRNKCTFTIGLNIKDEVTVGNRLGKYKDNNCFVEEPSCLRHVSDGMKNICKSLQELVVKSVYPVYNRHSHEGHWQDVTIRNNRLDQYMVVVSFCRQNLEKDKVEELKKELADHLCKPDNQVHTLLFSLTAVRDRNLDQNGLQLLHGPGFLYEELLGFKFRVSPSSFFQCNTGAAEVLYKTIEEMALKSLQQDDEGKSEENGGEQQPKKKKVLLDVCCGTGTIGICMSRSFDKVYGIDICAAAIEDARLNAELNGVKNMRFFARKAEDILGHVLNDLIKDEVTEVVAVVDPPRCGVHSKVIAAIRACERINSLIYVSCSIKQSEPNVLDLVRNRSKRLAGLPFRPIECRPLDLFPHTAHVEVVTAYRRLKYDNEAKPQGEEKASEAN